MLDRKALVCLWTLIAQHCCSPALANEAWHDIRKSVFGTAAITEDDGTISLDVPARAEDAALVPLSLKLAEGAPGQIRKITVIVDENPSPVAAVVNIDSPETGGLKSFATRVRVDRYTYVRAIAEAADGSLHMSSKFIKASGGCSAPASKDAEAALQDIGKLKVKLSAGDTSSIVDIAIRHPNFSGMQMDQVTRAYTPARFIEELRIAQGGKQIARLEGGISISENPNFRLEFLPLQRAQMEVVASDTTGAKFEASASVVGY